MNTFRNRKTKRGIIEMRFLVVIGTVREGRWSIHPARYVTRLLDREHDAELFDMAEKDVPLLENTRYSGSEVPEDVEEFGQKVEEADGIVIVTPEYNHSIPGALKNLLDYLYPEYEDKPFSYVTVSAGGFGGVRALSHLHDITLELNAHPGPDIPVSRVRQVFNRDGELVDQDYEQRFKEFAEKVVEHAEKFK